MLFQRWERNSLLHRRFKPRRGCCISNVSCYAGISLFDAGTSPFVSRNTIRDCKRGVYISDDVDPSWTLGEGNVFTNCAEGDVVDRRGQANEVAEEMEEEEEAQGTAA